ncbi:protein of unknown function [Methylocaldum szegediense]|uniref:Uncharacterized protein n=1 Tax=Methylocaldum szegediense TaxID=73780 RepID=A0ABM9HXZ6_9GAMM|nr:protein of unknown function [Methylocaldum szegediense]
MTPNPVCCTSCTDLESVARLMVRRDCGEIPGVENLELIRLPQPSQGKDTMHITAGACMSTSCVTATLETSLENCCKTDRKKLAPARAGG